ncbi:hypothetical protein SERLADRAFT_389031 [Serpula lacrymans var. lacrymans S7.9]|nr:uncharacterized protein SERLADRAFT_389031 [Serpula lacrymans var. lacrymans S7.9]EGO24210.1 hypothetical protein SERLADRAFT_389031 [Serpula lacrymans var. lacrymans S7.9]
MDVSQNEDTIAFENYELFIEQDTKDDIVEGLPIVVDVPAEPTPVVQVTPVPDIGDGMTIMYDGQGPNRPGTVSIKFQIEESLLPMISTWVNQSRTNVVDRSSSLCVSLACYLLSDLEDAYVRAIEKPTTTEQLLSMTKSLWPDSGTLSLRFHHKDVDMHLPLSPPIVVTPDQYFDLSQFIKGGQNEFKLLQRCDMSNCVYFVQVHHPTQLQLGVLASRRQLDESWNQFLATMKRPLEHQAPWNEIIKPSS